MKPFEVYPLKENDERPLIAVVGLSIVAVVTLIILAVMGGPIVQGPTMAVLGAVGALWVTALAYPPNAVYVTLPRLNIVVTHNGEARVLAVGTVRLKGKLGA